MSSWEKHTEVESEGIVFEVIDGPLLPGTRIVPKVCGRVCALLHFGTSTYSYEPLLRLSQLPPPHTNRTLYSNKSIPSPPNPPVYSVGSFELPVASVDPKCSSCKRKGRFCINIATCGRTCSSSQQVHRFTSDDGPIDAATAIHLNMLASKFRDDAEGERDEIVSVKNSWKTREAAENQALK